MHNSGTKQYHEFSPEVVRIMAANPMLLLRVREKLQRHKPLIQAILNGQSARLSQNELGDIIEGLDSFETQAGSELRKAIQRLKNDLAQPELLAQFGFTVVNDIGANARKALPREKKSEREEHSSTAPARLQAGYGKLPLTFEPNQGQADAGVDYIVRGRPFNLYLTAGRATLALRPRLGVLAHMPIIAGGAEVEGSSRDSRPVVHMQLAGSNPNSPSSGLEKLPAKSHYLMGSDPARWRTNVPHYRKVRYEEVYPGVDLVYYGRKGQFEYDLIVVPEANPEQITLGFQGIDALEMDSNGDLRLHHPAGDLRLKKPYVYQEIDGVRQGIAGRYVLTDDDQVGFHIASYDPSRPLVIDPVLSYSSYLGSTEQDAAMAIAVDNDGNAYLTGATTSADFPTRSPLASDFVGGGFFGSDGFVTKLSAAGTELLYSIYFGGSGDEIGLCIAVDAEGNAYVTGATSSSDFPTAQPVQTAFGGGGENYGTDAFVLKLNPSGSGLVYSTYLGGADDDGGSGIAVDSDGSAYITGATASTDFPTVEALQPANGGGERFASDAFVAKLNAAGTALAYATYLGGSGDEADAGIAVDASGNAYITGLTYSTDFPVMNPMQDSNRGSADVFVAKLNPAGAGLLYSSYLGGQGDDFGLAIALDGEGSAYLTGLTGSSSDFPLLGAAQPEFGSEDGLGFDAFVMKVKADGSELIYSTYLGGSDAETGFGIAIDSEGNAYVSGETASTDFPTMNAIQPTIGGLTDGFVAKLNPTGSSFDFSTYLGGSEDDFVGGVAVDPGGNSYVTGGSGSADAPATFGSFQTISRGGGADALVAKIVEGVAPPTVTTVSAASFAGGGALAPASISSGFGTDLATAKEVATTVPLPTLLAGTTVRLTDSEGTQRLAELFFISPGQINYLIPEATEPGLALVNVERDGQQVATGTVQINPVAPALFTADASGQGVAVAFVLRVAAGQSRSQELIFDPNSHASVPIDLGPEGDQIFLLLFGTGVRGFTSEVTATVGGESVPALGALPQPQFVGLDQINIGPLPRSLAGRGEVNILLTADGKPANTVTVNVR